MSSPQVLVVGASVAGPMTAYWLAKAGAQVTVIERFPQLRTNGQAIDIRTAGVTVMRKIPGMEKAVRAKRWSLEGISFVRSNGKPFATMKPSGNPNQQSLVSEYEILRGDLSQILYDQTKDNKHIKYIFNEQIASMQRKSGDDGPITVEFENVLPTTEYDLVVACDGATSRTRALGLNCSVREHMHPINSWSAYFSIDRDLLCGSKTGQSFTAVRGRWLAVGPDASSSTGTANRVVIMGVNPRDAHDRTVPFRKALQQGTDALKGYIAQQFEGAGWKTDEILARMMSSTDFYAAEIVQVRLPHLSHGRFVLVGDAGYAPGPTGTGTSLAMTGAYVLAGEVCRHKGDLGAALRAYEERMRPVIEDMQRIPRGFPGVLAPQTKWGIWARNVGLVVVAWGIKVSGLFKWAGGIWGSSFGGDRFGLPEYEWER